MSQLTESKLPEIRFKGFNGEWVEKQLGEIATYKNGKGHEHLQSSRGKYELVNLNSISISGGLKRSGKFIDVADGTLEVGDLVMILSDVAHGNLLGRVARIPENDKFVLNQRVALLRPVTEKSSTYLLYGINANQDYFKLRGAGMSQLNISKDSVTEFTLFIPSQSEQTQIGSYFKSLDLMIGLHQRKHDKLVILKQAMLQKMFPQDSSTAPEIRFKGFTEPWNEIPIGEILSEKKRSIELEDDEQYELITVKRRNAGVVSRGHLLGRDILVKNYSRLETGDFLISKRQVVHGATGLVSEKLNNAIVSNEYLVAVGNTRISTEFLTILSSLPEMRKKYFLSSYGVDIEKLFFDVEDWKKRTIKLPKLSEQNEIGTYFRKLDDLISKHTTQLEKLKNIKAACLKKMFV